MAKMEFLGEDYDRPLSADEVTWLRSWNQDELLADNDAKHGLPAEVAEGMPAQPSNLVGVPLNLSREQIVGALRTLDPEERQAVLDEAAAMDERDEAAAAATAEGDDYDDWKHKELKTEADSRDPKVEYPANPTRPQLIEALRAWDRAHPEAITNE